MKCKYCSYKLNEIGNELYHCSFCDLPFSLSELDRPIVRKIELDKNANFYQDMTTSDLINLTVIELTNYLSLARKEKRRLYSKVYSKTNKSDEIDKENFQRVNKFVTVIERLLTDKQGYFPSKVYESVIQKDFERVKKYNKYK